jgi:hypothetical protein
VTVTDTDNGFRRQMQALRELASAHVVVGIREEAGRYEGDGDDGPATVAQVAAFNEFGLGVPERSFLRATFDGKRKELEAAAMAEVRGVLEGRQDVTKALSRLGLRAAADVQATITELREPPNAPATIKKKGSSKPLIDTGRLRASVDFEVRPGPPPGANATARKKGGRVVRFRRGRGGAA